MVDTVLFDLGNTLVRYYTRAEWPGVRLECVAAAQDALLAGGLIGPAPADLIERVAKESATSPDGRVQPLEGRLARIFGLSGPASDEVCRAFMAPIFALGRPHDDTLPVLEALRARGVRTAIVSNSPWGSPPHLWREELARLGLAQRVDAAFFCGDCGWRKPAPQIFEYVLGSLGVTAGQCLFVGDDPRWDLAGPQAVGMPAVIVDRTGATPGSAVSLAEATGMLLEGKKRAQS
jgi:putative hydrolase of the HAD superfamily